MTTGKRARADATRTSPKKGTAKKTKTKTSEASRSASESPERRGATTRAAEHADGEDDGVGSSERAVTREEHDNARDDDDDDDDDGARGTDGARGGAQGGGEHDGTDDDDSRERDEAAAARKKRAPLSIKAPPLKEEDIVRLTEVEQKKVLSRWNARLRGLKRRVVDISQQFPTSSIVLVFTKPFRTKDRQGKWCVRDSTRLV